MQATIRPDGTQELTGTPAELAEYQILTRTEPDTSKLDADLAAILNQLEVDGQQTRSACLTALTEGQSMTWAAFGTAWTEGTRRGLIDTKAARQAGVSGTCVITDAGAQWLANYDTKAESD